MKIIFNSVAKSYKYPITKRDISLIKKIFPLELLEKIISLTFGCNQSAWIEGRARKRGKRWDVRINFCLKGDESPLLSNNKLYLAELKNFGANVDFQKQVIRWPRGAAKRYALYVLIHELAHIWYSENKDTTEISFSRKNDLEKWCNEFSMKKLKIIEQYLEKE
jgi:hypothetical protein